MDLKQILTKIKQRGLLPELQRIHYPAQDDLMSVVKAVGQAKHPRFIIDDDNRFAYENAVKWLFGDDTMQAIDPMTGKVIRADLGKGLFIAGPTGVGKSWLLDIISAVAMALNLHFIVDDKPVCLYWRSMRADEICALFAQQGHFSPYDKKPILCIQDLGSEPSESIHMGNRQNVIRQLIEQRGDRTDCLTVISSNYRLHSEAIKQSYGDRAQSRLVEMCNYLEIRGRDRRITKK